MLGFNNVTELQRRLGAFKEEAIPARSFDFVCHFQQHSVPVKVLLARLCDKLDGQPKSILVHKKKFGSHGRRGYNQKPLPEDRDQRSVRRELRIAGF